ncbi:hypothetical protein FGB62_50g29 [Gracilaria domingensis]|nr:hypothetical protein FGB62_50g29 [Gracilaria domingensis]
MTFIRVVQLRTARGAARALRACCRRRHCIFRALKEAARIAIATIPASAHHTAASAQELRHDARLRLHAAHALPTRAPAARIHAATDGAPARTARDQDGLFGPNPALSAAADAAAEEARAGDARHAGRTGHARAVRLAGAF